MRLDQTDRDDVAHSELLFLWTHNWTGRKGAER
jgi:hypothetical protein